MYYITHHRRSARARPGFTLIELMVVMMIIGVLATMLIPAVQAARIAAKVAKTKTLVFSLETALNMFKSEERLGRYYPPSYIPRLPMPDDPWGGTGPEYDAWGAQTLVWAVTGADLLGTPGFPDADNERLVDMYRDRNRYPRYGPFIDPTNLDIAHPQDEDCALSVLGRWAALSPPIYNVPPVILDAFGMPILYYRPDQNAPTTNIWDVLPRRDNLGFTNLEDGFSAIREDDGDVAYENFFMDRRTGEFSTGGEVRPYNYDTFVLLSAGPDRRYGTADDVANFPVGEN